jgi:hypothetical protein
MRGRLVMTVALVAAAVGAPAWAEAAPVICKKRSGTMVVRDPACKRKETPVDLAQFGAVGPKGDPGDPGPLVTTLPSGATLRGAYTYAGHKATGYSPTHSLSFAFPLPAEPTLHVIGLGGSPTAECPGSAADPQAMPGHVCVYETRNDSGTALGVNNDISDGRFGTQLFADVSDDTDFQFDGTWAATAP